MDPFTIIWGILTSKVAGPIAAGVALFLAATLAFTTVKANIVEAELRHDVAASSTKLAAVTKDRDTARANLADKTKALATVETAVTALRIESANRTATADKALTAARIATAAYSKQEAAIAAVKPGADACKSTADVLMEGIP